MITDPGQTETGYTEDDATERPDVWHVQATDPRTQARLGLPDYTLCGLKITWQFIQPADPSTHCSRCRELDG